MARLLKQSTAFTFRIGPFVDATDGVTAETALTIAQADIQISKNGGAFAQTSASPTTTHDADGWYQCPLTSTDTGTLGPLTVQIVMTGAAPVWEHFMVVPAMVYDSLVGGTDTLDVQVTGMGANVLTATAIASDAITAAKVADDVSTEFRTKAMALTTCSGVVGSGSTTANVVASSVAVGATTSISADAWKGRVIIFNSDTSTAALRGQAAAIVSHTSGTTPTFTLATGAWTTAPLSGDSFTVV